MTSTIMLDKCALIRYPHVVLDKVGHFSWIRWVTYRSHIPAVLVGFRLCGVPQNGACLTRRSPRKAKRAQQLEFTRFRHEDRVRAGGSCAAITR